jgi:hypothetical protein
MTGGSCSCELVLAAPGPFELPPGIFFGFLGTSKHFPPCLNWNSGCWSRTVGSLTIGVGGRSEAFLLGCSCLAVGVGGNNKKNNAAITFSERAASKMVDHLQPWQDFVHSDAEAMGATATAYDTSLRVWFNDDRKLRVRGQVTLQHNLVSGEFRIAYHGQQVNFYSGNPLRLTVSSSLLLPHPTEWVLPKGSKVAGNTTKGRVFVMGFASGVMFQKLQVAFKITEDNDQGKFFIRSIERIQRDVTGKPNRRSD